MRRAHRCARCRADNPIVSSSIGKKPQVAPYSGAMLPIVARSASDRSATTGPKNSTNLPTTPYLRSICVTASTRSVAVTPSFSLPVSFTPMTSGSSIEIGLAEHRGFRLDAADAPAEHGKTVDHRCVRVGADERVRIGDLEQFVPCRRS